MKYLTALILLVAVVGFVLLVPVGIWKACAAAEERKYGKALAWLLPAALWILVTLAAAYIRFLQLLE